MQISYRRVGRLAHIRRPNSLNKLIRLFLSGVSLLPILVWNAQCQTAAVARSLSVSDGIDGGVVVVVCTNKKQYRSNEPITVYSFLENRSDRTYYVGKTFYSHLYSGLHDLELSITDWKGNSVSLPRSAGDWIWKPNTSVKDKIAQAYIELAPDLIYGMRESLDLNLKPGTYKLSVVYRENEAVEWPADQIQELPIRVWTKTLKSNEVIISIR